MDNTAVDSVSWDLNAAGQWEVRPVFRAGADGIDKFNAGAAVCYAGAAESPCPAQPDVANGHGQMAMLFDGRVLTAPTIDAPKFDRDQITIAGDLTELRAKQTAAMIDSGALPARLDVPPA